MKMNYDHAFKVNAADVEDGTFVLCDGKYITEVAGYLSHE